MTTHEADLPADNDTAEENEHMVFSEDLTDEQPDRRPGGNADDAIAHADEPVEDDADRTWAREDEALDEGTDESEVADPSSADSGEASASAPPELADEDDLVAAGQEDRSDPLQKLEPVGADAPMDPGTGSYEDRWGAIQTGFIDDPRRTTESAGALVAEIWDEIVQSITAERDGIDERARDAESSTDDLRAVMQDYRVLYGRLVGFTAS